MKRFSLTGILLIFITLILYSEVKNVLVLNSYHQGYHWTDREMDGIRSILDPIGDVELHINYMDARRWASPAYEEQLYETYKVKYRDFSFDAILVTDDYGLDFLLARGDSLFPGVPVIFCGINFYEPSRIEGHSNYAGVHEDYDIVKTISLMKNLHPDSRRLAVITDSTLTGTITLDRIREAEKEFEGEFIFEYFSDLSAETLSGELQKLDEDSLILWGIFLKDKKGDFFTVEEGIQLVKTFCRLPIYSHWDNIGFGTIGGYVSDPFMQGQKGAEKLIRLLQGESIQNLGVHGGDLIYKFDNEQLILWGISKRLLPENRLIINKRRSLIGENRPFFLTLLVLIAVLVLIIFFLFWDIDRNRKMEKKLLISQELLSQSRKMDAVGQLAGGVAHDFNNLLTGIMGASELIQSENTNEEIGEYVQMIIDSSSQAAELTSQLLAFGRKGTRERTNLNVHDTIRDTLRILKKTIEKKIDIQIKLDTVNPMVWGIKSNIQNILMNLCINASQAMEEGGIITIITGVYKREKNRPHPRLVQMVPGDYLVLSVKDTGPGIPHEILDKIFEPYFTTKENGSGLGLATVYGTVSDHGGYIYADSIPGEGTTFHIFLPRSQY